MTDTIKDVMETLIEYANGGVSGLYPPEDDIQELVDYILDLQEEIERLKELCDKYEEEHKTTFETWQKDIKENKLLHSIINELERYINEEYIYDELGMKIFDASELQDKLQELKGSENSD